MTRDEFRFEVAKQAGKALAERVGWDKETRTSLIQKTHITRERMQQMGMGLWPRTFANVDEDDMEGAVVRLLESAITPEMRMFFMTEVGQTSAINAARWAHYGFPIVQYSSHKYCAALMATKIPEGEILPPWKTFLIELPTGLLQTRDGADDEYRDIVYCMVSYHPFINKSGEREYGWTIDSYTRDGMNLHVHRQSLHDIRTNSVERAAEEFADIDPFAYEMSSEDDRTLELMARLVLNTCVAMSNPDVVRPIGKHPKVPAPKGPSRNGKEPLFRVYRVGKEITLDCREALRSYVRGTRRGPLTVQFLVRGHWRQQACGPRFSDRKATWIEPYWKGPEDAPIPVRGTKVGAE